MATVGTSSAYTCTPGPFGHNCMLVAGIVVLTKTLVTLYWAAARRFLVEMAALFDGMCVVFGLVWRTLTSIGYAGCCLC